MSSIIMQKEETPGRRMTDSQAEMRSGGTDNDQLIKDNGYKKTV
jgi:hypothetical protein